MNKGKWAKIEKKMCRSGFSSPLVLISSCLLFMLFFVFSNPFLCVLNFFLLQTVFPFWPIHLWISFFQFPPHPNAPFFIHHFSSFSYFRLRHSIFFQFIPSSFYSQTLSSVGSKMRLIQSSPAEDTPTLMNAAVSDHMTLDTER